MLRPGGYHRIEGGPEGLVEEDTFTCRHCQRLCFVPVGRTAQFHTCKLCYAPICPRCANLPCDHFERKLERIERAASLGMRFAFVHNLERYTHALLNR